MPRRRARLPSADREDLAQRGGATRMLDPLCRPWPSSAASAASCPHCAERAEDRWDGRHGPLGCYGLHQQLRKVVRSPAGQEPRRGTRGRRPPGPARYRPPRLNSRRRSAEATVDPSGIGGSPCSTTPCSLQQIQSATTPHQQQRYARPQRARRHTSQCDGGEGTEDSQSELSLAPAVLPGRGVLREERSTLGPARQRYSL